MEYSFEVNFACFSDNVWLIKLTRQVEMHKRGRRKRIFFTGL